MTLVIGLKSREGGVLASDTRVMLGGDLIRDRAVKLEPLTDEIGVATTGLTGATDDILQKVKAYCESSASKTFDAVVSCLSDATLEWYKKNCEKMPEEEGSTYSFVVVSADRIKRVLMKGYSEESSTYECDGSGKPNAEYILGNMYAQDLSEEEAKELAVYAIVETSKIDPNVSDDIELLAFPKGGKVKTVSKADIQDIKVRVAPTAKRFAEERIRVVERIVDQRDKINDLWETKFRFKLFRHNERAVFEIMKPCTSEADFTLSIAALALLVDQLNVKEMKEVVGRKEGSINVLEEFVRQRIGDHPPEIITNFRDIMTMRSKKFPIHTTESKFVEVVIKIAGTYPPKWSDLYMNTLAAYAESLGKLLDCLRKQDKSQN